MTWFVQRRLSWPPVLAILTVTALTMLLGELPFPVPSLGLGPLLRMSLAMFLPSLIACAVGAVTTGGLEREAIARRPLGLIDTTWNILLTAIAAAPHLVLVTATSAPGAGEAARNVFGFLGVGLVARKVLRGAGVTAAPALFAIVTAVLSTTYSSAWISWPYRPDGDRTTWVVAGGIWILGLVIGTGRHALASQGEPEGTTV
jgi:hypothetical protein